MNTHHKLSFASYLTAFIAGDTWTFGWIFGGFTSLFLYIFNPLNLFPLSISSIFFFIPAIAPVILICIGLLFIYRSVNESIHAISIIKNGEIADGTLVMLHFYGERINDKKVWWGEYHFTTMNGERYSCIGKIGRFSKEMFDNGYQLILTENLEIDHNFKKNIKNDIEYSDQISRRDFEKIVNDNVQVYLYQNHFEKPESFKELINNIKVYFAIHTGRQLMPNEQTTEYPAGLIPVFMQIFYNNQMPEKSVPLISIPGKFTMDNTGVLKSGNLFVPGLIVPILVICIHILIYNLL